MLYVRENLGKIYKCSRTEQSPIFLSSLRLYILNKSPHLDIWSGTTIAENYCKDECYINPSKFPSLVSFYFDIRLCYAIELILNKKQIYYLE